MHRMLSVGFGLVAGSMLAAQIVLSRLLAGTMTYYYAFMLISLAMLGLASGGLLAQLGRRFFTAERVREQASVLAAAAGIAGFVGTVAITVLVPMVRAEGTLRFYVADFWVLGGIFWSTFPFFLLGGLLVSLILNHHRERFHQLYAVDLVSAAVGCVVAVLLLDASTPTTAMLTGVCILPMVAAAAFAVSGERRGLAVANLGLAGAFLLLGHLLSTVGPLESPPHMSWPGVHTFVARWNSISAVRVHPSSFGTWALSERYQGPAHPMRDLLIDGIGGTRIVRFNGNPASLSRYEYLDFDLTALAHQLVPPKGRQLIIGPGGGVDILQALRAGKKDLTAVEINPLVAEVVNEDQAGFSGSPYQLPGVQLHLENGRTFIKRSDQRWDLITLTWVDTGGSASALAFSENYLYTVEAYREYLTHLTPDGYFGFLRALGDAEILRIDSQRGIAVAREALVAEGATDPGRHLLVAAVKSPFFSRAMCLVLVKRTPITDAEEQLARAHLDRFGFTPLWLPSGGAPAPADPAFARYAQLTRELITRTDRQALYDGSSLDLAPSTDDNPFYFVERAGPNRKAGAGVKELQALVLMLLALVLPFLVLPLLQLARGTQRLMPRDLVALAYFALLGVAFMMVEMEFLHVFALLLGSPTRTLATVLASMLVFSGLGSLAVQRLATTRRAWLVFAALCAALAAFLGAKGWLLDALVGLPLVARLAATVACIAPVAFLMGLPMSTGMALVARREHVVLWGWAMNGVFSVFASAAAIYLAIHVGTAATFAAGTVAYGLAGALSLAMAPRQDGEAPGAPAPEPAPAP